MNIATFISELIDGNLLSASGLTFKQVTNIEELAPVFGRAKVVSREPIWAFTVEFQLFDKLHPDLIKKLPAALAVDNSNVTLNLVKLRGLIPGLRLVESLAMQQLTTGDMVRVGTKVVMVDRAEVGYFYDTNGKRYTNKPNSASTISMALVSHTPLTTTPLGIGLMRLALREVV